MSHGLNCAENWDLRTGEWWEQIPLAFHSFLLLQVPLYTPHIHIREIYHGPSGLEQSHRIFEIPA